MPVVCHKAHSHSETDPQKLKILRKRILEHGKPVGTAWSIRGDDRGETIDEYNSVITAFDTEFTIPAFIEFCLILAAWYKTKTLFGGWECVMVYPVPNISHSRYYAPGGDQPMDYPLDEIDPHYRVPRRQYETMKSGELMTASCAILTAGRRWFNVLGHPIGESYTWSDGDILWDRSNLLWLPNFRLKEEQFQQLWNHSLAIFNLGKGYRFIFGVEMDRQDVAFLLAVQSERKGRDNHV